MALDTLKSVTQNTWLRNGGGPSRNGVCYYMCNFLESDLGSWKNPGSFSGAVGAAKNFSQAAAMMNYAKAQSLKHLAQRTDYVKLGAAPLENNKIYRVGLWVGAPDPVVAPVVPPAVVDPAAQPVAPAVPAAAVVAPPKVPNHEMILITGNGTDVVYFEPNFGFFQASNDGMNNTQAVEFFVNQQYGALPAKWQSTAFEYLEVRSNSAGTPKGFIS